VESGGVSNCIGCQNRLAEQSPQDLFGSLVMANRFVWRPCSGHHQICEADTTTAANLSSNLHRGGSHKPWRSAATGPVISFLKKKKKKLISLLFFKNFTKQIFFVTPHTTLFQM
jgi:hypothetical protein